MKEKQCMMTLIEEKKILKLQLYDWSVLGGFFDLRIKTGESLRFLQTQLMKELTWEPLRVVLKNRKILRRRSFLGALRNWGPTHYTC